MWDWLKWLKKIWLRIWNLFRSTFRSSASAAVSRQTRLDTDVGVFIQDAEEGEVYVGLPVAQRSPSFDGEPSQASTVDSAVDSAVDHLPESLDEIIRLAVEEALEPEIPNEKAQVAAVASPAVPAPASIVAEVVDAVVPSSKPSPAELYEKVMSEEDDFEAARELLAQADLLEKLTPSEIVKVMEKYQESIEKVIRSVLTEPIEGVDLDASEINDVIERYQISKTVAEINPSLTLVKMVEKALKLGRAEFQKITDIIKGNPLLIKIYKAEHQEKQSAIADVGHASTAQASKTSMRSGSRDKGVTTYNKDGFAQRASERGPLSVRAAASAQFLPEAFAVQGAPEEAPALSATATPITVKTAN